MFDRQRRFVDALLLGAALSLTACGGPDITATCEAREACLGGNEADINACIASYEGVIEIASDIGCGEEYDAYLLCQEGLSSCRELPGGGGMCASDADCDNDGSRCSGGQCVRKFYGLDPQADDLCEGEQNAFQRCF